MTLKTSWLFCTFLLSSGLFAQTETIQTILQKVEQNNSELQAFNKYIESQSFALQSTNTLPNPDFYDKTKLVSYIFLLLTTLQTRAMILFLTALSTDILFLPSATFLR